MAYEKEGLGELVAQIKEASANIADADARTNKRLDELTQSVNALYRKHGRPGGCEISEDVAFERESAIELRNNRRAFEARHWRGRQLHARIG